MPQGTQRVFFNIPRAFRNVAQEDQNKVVPSAMTCSPLQEYLDSWDECWPVGWIWGSIVISASATTTAWHGHSA